MHKYMRAVGFSDYTNRKKRKELLTDVIMNSDTQAYAINSEKIMLGEFCKNFASDMGIVVCGEFDEKEQFLYDYYYPYFHGSGITTFEDISIDRHAAQNSYAGVCDDLKVGISIIFYLKNRIPYIKAQTTGKLPVKGTTLTLSALSVSGIVLMQIRKDEQQKEKVKRSSLNRSKLLAAARRGDEDAMESLALEDMEMYNNISYHIKTEDVFSLVDTYFMPYGVECDQYSILGEIEKIKLTTNYVTQEQIYILTISCNDLIFDVCINVKDLYGEPKIGRRFKGVIWLQGYINFPDNSFS